MFGVRRALETLPASHWEQFIAQWRSLTEAADFDVTAVHAALRREVRRRSGSNGTDEPVAAAWRIVAEATARYVTWRATHRAPALRSTPPDPGYRPNVSIL